ncbi:MAG: hypothetical protein Q4D27_09210 [Coriobacteriia bacterium]|nr:hypothetical protein [Coriobacteriia bacterium]
MDATTAIARRVTPAKVLAVLVALLVALAFVPGNAYAASKTVKTQGFTTTAKVVNKKATTVKAGTTKLTYKSGQGYIKFKATKTKVYSFTFSNVKGKGTNNVYASFYRISKYSKKYIEGLTVKTKGGKDETLWLSANGYKFTGDYYTALDKPIATRTGKVKLTKGQMVYIYLNGGGGKTTATLKIK